MGETEFCVQVGDEDLIHSKREKAKTWVSFYVGECYFFLNIIVEILVISNLFGEFYCVVMSTFLLKVDKQPSLSKKLLLQSLRILLFLVINSGR